VRSAGGLFQQSLIDDGNLEAARFWGQVKRFTNAGVGALYTRGAIRMCKHPFDFRSDHAEYHNGSGGEWRILRDGRLYKTDPKKIGDPTACTEPTPFDALDLVEQMTITDTNEVDDTLWDRCQRFAGTAYGGGVSVPLISGEPMSRWPSRCSLIATGCCARSISRTPPRSIAAAPR
jgi:hypothetical protein